MAKPEWGVKRGCLNCGTKFYDFGRDPIVCPSCESSFHADDFTRPRRGARPDAKPEAVVPAAPAKKRAAPIEDETEDLADVEADLDVDIDDVDDADEDPEADNGDAGDESDDEEMALDGDVELEGVEDDDSELDEEDEAADDVLEADEDEDLESEISSEIDTDFRKEDVS